jgi:hypothetical protein
VAIIKADQKKAPTFPRPYATRTSVNEAIILKWLAHKTRRSKNRRDGKQWFYGTFSKMSERFPYLSRSSITRAIGALKKAGLIEIANYNKLKIDKTHWYHVPQPHRDATEKDLIKFDPDIAKDHGVLAGVLVQNLRHWLRLRKKKGKTLAQEMSAVTLNRAMPFFSVSAIKRSLKQLQQKGAIVRLDARRPIFTLPEFQNA